MDKKLEITARLVLAIGEEVIKEIKTSETYEEKEKRKRKIPKFYARKK